MKQSRYYPLLAVGCLLVTSCGVMSSLNQPISGGSTDPLDSPGASARSSEPSEPAGPAYSAGQWLETSVPSAALYSRVPRGNDQPYRTLQQGTPLKVIATDGTYVRVELESGDIGYVPSIMVAEKSSLPLVPGTPGAPSSDDSGIPIGSAPEPEVTPLSVEDASSPDTINPGDKVIELRF
ncbi:MAG: hypothetical protein HKN82_07335 [Akkermansiaceae bacterium]|nr:hypothetical protein [Akkermansiaceae bacterium]NNM30944.1 hypothetical protein [Akkermansiaceae bacterium]